MQGQYLLRLLIVWTVRLGIQEASYPVRKGNWSWRRRNDEGVEMSIRYLVPSLRVCGATISLFHTSLWNFSIVKPTRCINVSNLFYWSNTLHVSDGLSVHHQELKTVHTAAGICQTDTAVCLLASSRQYLFDICLLLYVQSLTPDDGRKDRPKHAECYSNKINLRHWCIWLVSL